MNVEQIIVEYLKANGYDGLAGDDCGCGIDDLFPCEGWHEGVNGDCQAAHKVENCDCEHYEPGHTCYRPGKKEGKA